MVKFSRNECKWKTGYPGPTQPDCGPHGRLRYHRQPYRLDLFPCCTGPVSLVWASPAVEDAGRIIRQPDAVATRPGYARSQHGSPVQPRLVAPDWGKAQPVLSLADLPGGYPQPDGFPPTGGGPLRPASGLGCALIG